jgi:hypothetical protein
MGRILRKRARSEDVRAPDDPVRDVAVSRPPAEEGRLWTLREDAHTAAAAELLGLFGVADAIALNSWF